MPIAVFGGSFNPPHKGHLAVLDWLLEQKTGPKARFESVWIIPAFQHPFEKQLIPFDTRIHLCKLLQLDQKNRGRSKVLDLEEKIVQENPDSFGTIDLIRSLKKSHPLSDFTLVLGSDLRNEIPTWKESQALQSLVEILFIPRRGHENESHLEFIAPEINSSQIRKVLSHHENPETLEKWLSPHVAQYLHTHNPFKEDTRLGQAPKNT